MKVVFYEKLFELNGCLEKAIGLLEHFQLEGLLHPEYAANRKQAMEELRSDLSYVLTGIFHRKRIGGIVGGDRKADCPRMLTVLCSIRGPQRARFFACWGRGEFS